MATAAWKNAMNALVQAVDDSDVYEVRNAGGYVYHEKFCGLMQGNYPNYTRIMPKGLAEWLGLKPCAYCGEVRVLS